LKIIIAGIGKVGFTLAQNLSEEGHDITVIDLRDDAIRRASEVLDVLCIKANAASITSLKDAGVESCDVFIAVTDRDELNMVCCLTAKKLGAGYTAARIRDFDYASEIDRLKKELDIDLVINPEHAAASHISRLLRFPAATNIDTFYRGRIELVSFLVREGDVIAGIPLASLNRGIFDAQILFCAVERDQNISIPNGSTVFSPGDKVYVIGDSVNISRFFRSIRRIEAKVKDAFIVGGGRIGIYLASSLIAMNIGVKIVESDSRKCREYTEILPKALIINGDGTDYELLLSENVQESESFVALTDSDENNLIVSLYARQLGVKKTVAKINRQNYFGISGLLGIDSIVSPKEITAFYILKSIRALQNVHGSRMEALYRIADGSVEAAEFSVTASTRGLGTPIRDLKFKPNVLIAVIARKGRFIIPKGTDHMETGDGVIVITRDMQITDLSDIFSD